MSVILLINGQTDWFDPLQSNTYHHECVDKTNVDVGQSQDSNTSADDEGEDGCHQRRQEQGQKVDAELRRILSQT